MTPHASEGPGDGRGDALRLLLPPDLDALARANDDVERFLADRGASARALHAARLVVEELVTNVVKYAYDDATGREIGVDVDIAGDVCVVRVRDDGRAFDPTAAPPVEPPARIEDAAVGGLGLVMVRAQTRDLRWQRRDGENVVEAEIEL